MTVLTPEIAMKRLSASAVVLLLFAFALQGCAHPASGSSDTGWTTLIDGTNMNHFDAIGDANWRVAEGSVQADRGIGFLVSKNTYGDFEIRAEFWADAHANSGIFLRCSDRMEITDTNAYEVNIFDERPDPSYGTGAIVNVVKVFPMPKAAGRWNTYQITAKGDRFTVVLNGIRTVDGVRDGRLKSGPIALQRAAGVVKFRKVQIRPL